MSGTIPTRPRHLVAASTGVASAAALAALLATPASAAPGATTVLPATALGSISCGAVTYTITGGTAHAVNQMSQDAQGVYHFTGTLSLQNVTANDGTTPTSYSIVGSSWYGGKGTDPASSVVISTDELTVLDGSGKVADLHAALTFYPDGTVRGVSFGDCQPAA